MSDVETNPLAWRDAAVVSFRYHKNIADRAVGQIPDEALRRPLDPHTNSIAMIMKHVGGNLRSRWTGQKKGQNCLRRES